MLSPPEIERLTIVSWPNPILRKKCKLVTDFGEPLDRLTRKMLELMHANRGVGLAAPQVGLPWRLLVCNPTGQPQDDHVYINPQLGDLQDQEEGEEGCLSIESVTVRVIRARTAEMTAQLPDGSPLHASAEGLLARIWQHETDHLDGRLILDYQSATDEIANRRALKQLEEKYRASTKKRVRAPG